MKKIILSLLLSAYVCVGLQAQTKKMEETSIQTIKFKDGKTKVLKGILISELTEKNGFNDNLMKDKYIYSRKDSLVTFYVYDEWQKPAEGFNQLREYTFHINQLKVDGDFKIEENQPDDNFTTKYYTLSGHAIEEKNFNINTYYSHKSTPHTTSIFGMFTLKSLKKESLEKVMTDLKSMLPKKKEDVYEGLQAQTKKEEEASIQTIKFRDEKTKVFKGILLSELTEKNAFDDKLTKYKYFYFRKDSLITFYVYQEWQKPASGFDEMSEYIFHINQLQVDGDFKIEENQPDDNFTTKYYTILVRAIDGKTFNINQYDRYKSTPYRTLTFPTFILKSLNKESLEKLMDDLKSMLPKKKTEED